MLNKSLLNENERKKHAWKVFHRKLGSEVRLSCVLKGQIVPWHALPFQQHLLRKQRTPICLALIDQKPNYVTFQMCLELFPTVLSKWRGSPIGIRVRRHQEATSRCLS